MRHLPALASILFAFAAAAHADTLVVDAQRGPGWNFDDIPRAVSEARPGDVILVRTGTYHAFTVAKRLTILGIGAPAVIDGLVTLRGIEERVSIAALSARELVIEDCTGVVTVQQMPSLERVTVRRCDDVRLHQLRVQSPPGAPREGLRVDAARVEVFESELHGSHATAGAAGGSALVAGARSRVHVVRTSASGGDGDGASDGGHGVRALEGSEVIVAGDGWTALRGGSGGTGILVPGGRTTGALPGCAISADSSSACTWTGASLETGGSPTHARSSGDGATCGATVTRARESATMLGVTGWPLAGGTLVIEVRGEPGARVRWWFGRKPTLRPMHDGGIELLARELDAFDLGPLPSSGALAFVFTVPTSYQTGTFFVCQAELKSPASGALQRTNSLPILVR